MFFRLQEGVAHEVAQTWPSGLQPGLFCRPPHYTNRKDKQTSPQTGRSCPPARYTSWHQHQRQTDITPNRSVLSSIKIHFLTSTPKTNRHHPKPVGPVLQQDPLPDINTKDKQTSPQTGRSCPPARSTSWHRHQRQTDITPNRSVLSSSKIHFHISTPMTNRHHPKPVGPVLQKDPLTDIDIKNKQTSPQTGRSCPPARSTSWHRHQRQTDITPNRSVLSSSKIHLLTSTSKTNRHHPKPVGPVLQQDLLPHIDIKDKQTSPQTGRSCPPARSTYWHRHQKQTDITPNRSVLSSSKIHFHISTSKTNRHHPKPVGPVLQQDPLTDIDIKDKQTSPQTGRSCPPARSTSTYRHQRQTDITTNRSVLSSSKIHFLTSTPKHCFGVKGIWKVWDNSVVISRMEISGFPALLDNGEKRRKKRVKISPHYCDFSVIVTSIWYHHAFLLQYVLFCTIEHLSVRH